MQSKRLLYHRLLSLYPKDYQFRFSSEMSRAFEAAAAEHLALGRTAFARFIAVELIGLLRGAGSEWITKWTTDTSVRSRYLPDLRMMRLPWVPRENRHLRGRGCTPDISQ
jgi:hypothetical protein